MKVLKIVLIILCLLLVAALVGILCLGLTGELENFLGGFDMGFTFFTNGGASWKEEFSGTIVPGGAVTIPGADITALNIQWIAGEVTIEYHPSQEISFEQTSSRNIPEDRLMVYRVDRDGTLNIREGAGRKVKSSTETNLVIYLPAKSTDHELRSVNISCTSSDISAPKLTTTETIHILAVSGDIELKDLTAGRNIELSTTSGDIDILGMHAGRDASIISTSGDITVRNGAADGDVELSTTSGAIDFASAIRAGGNLEISTVSGDINGDGSAAALIASTVSGDIELKGHFGTIEASAVNGDTEVIAYDAPASASLDSTNGDVTLTLPATMPGFTAEYDTVNGDFACAFPVTTQTKGSAVYGDGSTPLSFSTVNGDISILSK